MGFGGEVSWHVYRRRTKEETGFIKWLQMKFSSIHQCPTIFHFHFVSKYGIRSLSRWKNYKVFLNCLDTKGQYFNGHMNLAVRRRIISPRLLFTFVKILRMFECV
jgi:hypothetical protein